MKFDSEWKALTTFSEPLEGVRPWAYLSRLLRPSNLDYVKKKLRVIKFDLAMTNVPEDLEPIKNGLSEIYEIEINAFDTNEWNPNVTPSNVVEVISVIKAYPGPIGGTYNTRWTEAQLMRKKLYEYWITEMVDKGLGREFVEEFSKDLDELGAITNFGK